MSVSKSVYFRRRRILIMATVSAALMSCVSPETPSLQSEVGGKLTEAEKAQLTADSKFMSSREQYLEQAMDFSYFTIEGKPTKTIATPRGPVEIYDPIQDDYVRSRFAMYKQANYPPNSPFRKNLIRLNEILLNEYRRNYCSIITDGKCFTWDFKGCEGSQPISCMSLPPGAAQKYICRMGKKEHDIRAYKEKSNLDASMSKYFAFECHEWKK